MSAYEPNAVRGLPALSFFSALDGFYRADTLVASVLFGAVSLFMMVTAAFRADSPTQSFLIFRMLADVLFGLDLLSGFATGKWAGIEFWVLVLIAEYAATIRTIPPRETKKREQAQASRRAV